MDVTVADSPNFRTSRVDRSSGIAGRSHFCRSIVIHTVDSDARCSSYCCPYIHSAPGAHGVDLAPGICRDADGRMIARMIFIRVDTRVVQGRPAVFINIRYGSSSLKVEEILAPLHTEASAHADNAGHLQFRLAIFFRRLAVRCGNRNRTICGSRNVGMVDFRTQPLLVSGRTNGGIGHGSAHAHFLAANGNAARHGGLFHQIRRRYGKGLHAVDDIVSVSVVDDTLRVVDAPVDGYGAGSSHIGLGDIHVHGARHGQRFARVGSCQPYGAIAVG